MVIDDSQILSEISKKIDRLISIALIVNQAQIAELIKTEVNTKEKRQVYELTNGVNSLRNISDKTGVNISSISRWGQRWEKMGLITEDRSDFDGKRKRLFDLSVFEFTNTEK